MEQHYETEEEYSGMDWGKISVVISVIFSIILISLISFSLSPSVDNVGNKVDNNTMQTNLVKAILVNDVRAIVTSQDTITTSVNNVSAMCDRTQANYIDMSSKYTTCTNDKSSLTSDLIGTKSTLQTCIIDKSGIQSTFSVCQTQLSAISSLSLVNQAMLNGTIVGLNETIINLQANFTAINTSYNLLANNTAKLLCCVLINQTSANYTITNNAVSCSTSGNKQVSC